MFWLIFHLRGVGQTARSAGWISRLRRMLEDHDPDDELSYLVSLREGVAVMQAGAPGEGNAHAGAGCCRSSRGSRRRSLRAGGPGSRTPAWWRSAGQRKPWPRSTRSWCMSSPSRAAPPVVGLAYCAVISLCMERFDIRTRWRMDASAHRLVRRAIRTDALPRRVPGASSGNLQVHGSWAEATEEAVRSASACQRPDSSQAGRITGWQSCIDYVVSWILRSASMPLRPAAVVRCSPDWLSSGLAQGNPTAAHRRSGPRTRGKSGPCVAVATARRQSGDCTGVRDNRVGSGSSGRTGPECGSDPDALPCCARSPCRRAVPPRRG